jgi:hypothetical protein
MLTLLIEELTGVPVLSPRRGEEGGEEEKKEGRREEKKKRVSSDDREGEREREREISYRRQARTSASDRHHRRA